MLTCRVQADCVRTKNFAYMRNKSKEKFAYMRKKVYLCT